jgi:hypothetical protein
MTFGRKIASVAGLAAVVYGVWVRPRLMRWGASDEEVAGPYPGADLVPDGERGPTMAVTIDAPPDQVWPWLVQTAVERSEPPVQRSEPRTGSTPEPWPQPPPRTHDTSSG